MKQERILPFKMSKKLTEAELQNVSGSWSWTSHGTGGGSYGQSGADGNVDVVVDF